MKAIFMRILIAALLILSATSAEARYVRVWTWAWQLEPPRHFVHTPMTRAQIRAVYPALCR